MTTLSEEIHGRIKVLCADGDSFAQAAEYPTALSKYWAAWDLLPEPQTQWEAATWILGAIGDANYLTGDFVAGRDNLSLAMHYPNAIRSFSCDWGNANSSLEIWIERPMN